MFRRFLTVMALLALSTTPINRLAYSGVLTPSAASLKSAKEKKGCAPCALASEEGTGLEQLDKLATLGRRTQVQPLMPVQRSVFEGAPVNFVSSSSGQLSFAVTDLELAGAMPLMFQRIYASSLDEDVGLGKGWSFILDDRITLDNDKATLRTGGGALLHFRRDAYGRFRLQRDEPVPHQSFELINAETITEEVSGAARTYLKLGDTYRLSRIENSDGNAVDIRFDARGQIARIESSSGAAISLEWSYGAQPRLLSVRDNTGRRVAFIHEGRHLRAVTDPAGAQWMYDYQGGRLTVASDPLKRTLLRVRYDGAGRAVEGGDLVSAYLYDYDSTPGAPSRLTTITDPAGSKTYLKHSEDGMVNMITEGEGRSVRLEYNAAHRPVRIYNSTGEETTLAYDEQNRLVNLWSTDGTSKSYGYDERGRVSHVTEGGVRTDFTLDEKGHVTAAKSSDSSRSYRASYDSRGMLVSLKSYNREVSFEYDNQGNKTAYTYSGTGRFVLERDANGRVATERFPSGLNIYTEYDARGWAFKRSDNRGRSLRMESDASGAPIAFVRGDGKRMSASRDKAGRVVEVRGFDGGTRRFAYNAYGALTDYTDERGQSVRYEYDQTGRLRSITGKGGTRFKVERDERGRIRRLLPSAVTRLGKASLFSLAHGLAQDGEIYIGEVGAVEVTGTVDTWSYLNSSGLLGGSDTMNLATAAPDGERNPPAGVAVDSSSMTEEEKIQCATAILTCLASVGGYVSAMAGLISACAGTFGAGCLGALLLHPILGPLAVLLCSNAVNKCELNK